MIKNFFKEISNGVISALFPKHCICCEEIVDENEFLCDYCYEMIERIDADKRCLACGLDKKNCDCKRLIFHFEGCVVPFYNIGIAKRALYKLKLSHREYHTEFFAREIVLRIKEELPDVKFDGVCYVPGNVLNNLKRGFNQAELLAKRISEIMNIPLNKKALYMKRRGKGQHNLTGRERFINVRGMYGYNYRNSGKTLLLIDDIKTTGATLDECARQLLFSGAHHIYCACALATVQEYKNPTKEKVENGNRNRN